MTERKGTYTTKGTGVFIEEDISKEKTSRYKQKTSGIPPDSIEDQPQELQLSVQPGDDLVIAVGTAPMTPAVGTGPMTTAVGTVPMTPAVGPAPVTPSVGAVQWPHQRELRQ